MRFGYRIDSAQRLVVLSADHRPTVDEWFEAMEAMTSDPDYQPGFDVIYDRTRSDPPHDTAQTREWAERHAALAATHGGRLAVVVSTPLAYSVARTAAVIAARRGATIEVFWCERDARLWLGRAA